MTVWIFVAFAAMIVVGISRLRKSRRTAGAWQPWFACLVGALGVAAVLFDRQIDALLGGHNWVFVVELWSIYVAYMFMSETCRAVGHGGPITARRWVVVAVVMWCTTLTVLFMTLTGREGTLAHFVRDMFPQPAALAIGIMYSLGIVVMGALALIWLRKEGDLVAWLLRVGTALTVLAHFSRIIVTLLDYFNARQSTWLETALYEWFVPLFYGGLVCFFAGLLSLSVRRWVRETYRARIHQRRLHEIISNHRISPPPDAIPSPTTSLIAIEDSVRAGDVTLDPAETVTVGQAREWLTRTHDVGDRLKEATREQHT